MLFEIHILHQFQQYPLHELLSSHIQHRLLRGRMKAPPAALGISGVYTFIYDLCIRVGHGRG